MFSFHVSAMMLKSLIKFYLEKVHKMKHTKCKYIYLWKLKISVSRVQWWNINFAVFTWHLINANPLQQQFLCTESWQAGFSLWQDTHLQLFRKKNPIESKFHDQITIRISSSFALPTTWTKVVVVDIKFTGPGNWPFSSPQTQSYLLYGHPAEEIRKLKAASVDR